MTFGLSYLIRRTRVCSEAKSLIKFCSASLFPINFPPPSFDALHAMSLFTDNTRRTGALVMISVVVAHVLDFLIPRSMQAYSLVQAAVAMLSLSALMFFIYTHHNNGGNLITVRNEEHIIVGAFGLFWLAMLVLWRAMRQGSGGSLAAAASEVATSRQSALRDAGHSGRGSWPCSRDDVYCIVEEWSYI